VVVIPFQEVSVMDGHGALAFEGKTVVDLLGERIGKVESLFLDEDTGEPQWLRVDTGPFESDAIIPLVGIDLVDDDTVRVPYTRERVKYAPNMEGEKRLSADSERMLSSYYRIGELGEELPLDEETPRDEAA
jgi:hypothetical protein